MTSGFSKIRGSAKINPLIAAGMAVAAVAATPSRAQSTGDVVVMRRVVAPGVYDHHRWNEGAWSSSPQCSELAAQSRTVTCVNIATGATAPDANCHGEKPPTLRAEADYSACQYRWDYGTYGEWADACSDATYRTRTATCVRHGGGTPETVAPDDAACGPRGQLRDDAANYSGCSYTPTYGAFATCSRGQQTRSNTCVRDQTGRQVDPSTYCGIPSEQVQSCTVAPARIVEGSIRIADGRVGLSTFELTGETPGADPYREASGPITLGTGNGNGDYAGFACSYDIQITYGGETATASSTGRTSPSGSCHAGVSAIFLAGVRFDVTVFFTSQGNGDATYVYGIYQR